MTATTITFADSKSAKNVTAKKNNLNIAISQYGSCANVAHG